LFLKIKHPKLSDYVVGMGGSKTRTDWYSSAVMLYTLHNCSINWNDRNYATRV